MKMNKKLLSMAVGTALAATSQTSLAALPAKYALNAIDGVYSCIAGAGTYPVCTYGTNVASGSYFSMDQNKDGIVAAAEKVAIDALAPYVFNDLTVASGTHSGAIIYGAPESPVSDIWNFFGNTGMHYLTAPMVDNGVTGNTGTIDMTGWTVTWNGIAVIPMGGDPTNFPADTGLATIVCGVDCSDGDTFTLSYNATVPKGDPSNFGGVGYALTLVGTVNDFNVAPTATSNPLSSSVAPNGSARIDAVGNTTDPDGDGIDTASVQVTYTGSRVPAPTLEVCTAAITPNALCVAEGDIIYTDNVGTDTVTSDTFTYTLTDIYGAALAAPVTVNMDVVTGNLPPACGNAAVTTNVNTAIDIDVAGNATDNDGTIDVATVVTSGAVNGTPGTPTALGFVNFDPTPDFTGTASFDYTVGDNGGATCTTPGTITITVNALPVAAADAATVNRNSLTGVVIDVTANDTDSDGTVDKTSVAIALAPTKGTITNIDAVNGKITYKPTTGEIGADSFTYTVDDNDGATSLAGTVSITIVNALPVAVNDAATIETTLLSEVDISVLDNDTDSDGTLDVTTVTIVTDATNGTTFVKASGKVTYTPNTGYTGPDEFTYTVNDNDGGTSNIATVAVSVSNASTAILDPAAFLSIVPANITDIATRPAAGSWFSMETNPGVSYSYTAIKGFNQLQLGTSQPAFSGKTEEGVTTPASPNIDSIWSFFGNDGVHQTTKVVTILTDDGSGKVTLDLSGWNVSWNGIASIPMDSNATVSGFADGVAIMTCAVDCAEGDSYTLEYSATVPVGDASGFGGIHYFLHLEGTIALGATTVGGGNEAAPYVVDETSAVAVDESGSPVIVVPGATADSVGNTTGLYLTATDVGLKDPKLNEADGAQCIGGCIDFYATGIAAGSYIDLVVYLSEVIPEGTNYRKLLNGVWKSFDESQGDLVGSALAVTGACQGPEGVFQIGLRAGNQCLFLRIYDGGPNDADGVANGTIVDPSGVLLAGSPNVPASSTDGCSVSSVPVKLTERADWLLVAAFIAGFGLLTYRRRERNIR